MTTDAKPQNLSDAIDAAVSGVGSWRDVRKADLQNSVDYFRDRLSNARQRRDTAENDIKNDLEMLNELKREAYEHGIELS